MKRRRFRVKHGEVRGNRAVVTGDAARHMRQVLRLEIGTHVVLFDGAGREWTGKVRRLSKREVLVDLDRAETVATEAEAGPPVILLMSLARGSHTDLAIQKATELGVTEIRLFTSERTVAVPRPGGDPVRIDRLERIATDAARQSERAHVPPVLPPELFEEVVEGCADAARRVLLWTGDRERGLVDALGDWDRRGPVVLATGPEGGFTDSEVAFARECGFETAHLGPLVLRAETAAITAVALARLVPGGNAPALAGVPDRDV